MYLFHKKKHSLLNMKQKKKHEGLLFFCSSTEKFFSLIYHTFANLIEKV